VTVLYRPEEEVDLDCGSGLTLPARLAELIALSPLTGVRRTSRA
jgi:hypothetical protein